MVVIMMGDRMFKWLDINDLIGFYIDVWFKFRWLILEFIWESVSKLIICLDNLIYFEINDIIKW